MRNRPTQHYLYCNNNPVTKVDPKGDRTRVIVNRETKTIRVVTRILVTSDVGILDSSEVRDAEVLAGDITRAINHNWNNDGFGWNVALPDGTYKLFFTPQIGAISNDVLSEGWNDFSDFDVMRYSDSHGTWTKAEGLYWDTPYPPEFEMKLKGDGVDPDRTTPPCPNKRHQTMLGEIARKNTWHAAHEYGHLTVTPQLGYDSNIFGLEKDAPLIDGVSEEQSLYYGLVLGVKYFLHRSDTQLLSLEYRNQLRAYAEDRELNYSDNIFSAVGRQPFLEWADIEVRAALGEAVSDGEGHLRTTRTIAPALLFNFSPTLQARLWADWTDADYYISDLPAVQDRDGVITRAGLVFGIDLGAGWSLAPHFGIAKYDADGNDYDHQDFVSGLAVTSSEYLGCVFSPSVSYTRAEYNHENSVVGFSEKRQDRIWRFALTVSIRELEKVIGYAPSITIAFLDHSSNLGPYDYKRWEPRIEMTVVAMSF